MKTKLMKVYVVALVLSVALIGSAKAQDVVELASSDENLSTLVAAVKAGGMAEILKGDGPYTIFAPSDEAFASLPEGTLEELLKPENKDKLVALLQNHVVIGKVDSDELTHGMEAETVGGEVLTISMDQDVAMINDAKLLSGKVDASNGVVYVIDKVMLPASMVD